MSTRTSFSHEEIGALRDQAVNRLGKKVVMQNLTVPGTGGSVQDLQLNTQARIVLVTSEIEIYPYLQEGSKYKKAFGRSRDPHTAFTFQVQGGAPAVSVVLPDQEDAIAVIKKLMADNGEELSWSAVLERLGMSRTQFKNFVGVTDGVLLDATAALHLEALDDEEIDHDLRERPREDVPNLDSVLTLSVGAKRRLRTLLPDILRREQQPAQAE